MINVIGLGYIGLPTALMLAANGNKVIGTDINGELIKNLQQGEPHFNEKGLTNLMSIALNAGIEFSDHYQVADIYIVSVPSPYDKRTRKIDLRFIKNAVMTILKKAKKDAILVIESTISPGTTEQYIRPLLKNSNREDIRLAHAPERIIPGNMLYELKHNQRTIGADDLKTGEEIQRIYKTFCKGEIFLTDIKTAEMTKVVENTYRDINIAFANELCKICYAAGIDAHKVIDLANKHPRVSVLRPGPGVGGHCIAVDPWFLVGDYPGLANIILAARKINDSMPEFVLERLGTIMRENNMENVSKIGLYGLTYKENVDDTRESPTLQMLECMRKHLAYGVKVYDPLVTKEIVSNQYFDFDKFVKDIDLMVVMVGHDHIKQNQAKLVGKILFDTRNCLDLKNAYRL